MSRSFKKTPILKNCGSSDKKDKSLANRTLRKLVKSAIRNGNDVLPLLREVSDEWRFRSDGKRWIGNHNDYSGYLRK